MNELREDLLIATRRVMKKHDAKSLPTISALSWIIVWLTENVSCSFDAEYSRPISEDPYLENTPEPDRERMVTRLGSHLGVECEWGFQHEVTDGAPDQDRLHVWVGGEYRGSTLVWHGPPGGKESRQSVIEGILKRSIENHEPATP